MLYAIILLGILLIFNPYKSIRSQLRVKKLNHYQSLGYIDYYNDELPARVAFERLLGHPFAYQNIKGRYYLSCAKYGEFAPEKELINIWKPTLLAYLNISYTLSNRPIEEMITERFTQNWYRLGLMDCHDDDDIAAAIAFATAKLSFTLQLSLLLNFIDNGTHGKLMALNAIRARDCFGSWQEYAEALSKGRIQYLNNGHTDYIGSKITLQMVNEWLNDKKHPWHTISWPQQGKEPIKMK
ncbi:DUF1266 domain-containing protein [Thorsellia kenyensis]|uniref:DUF1266 domain-containing protein n=1 Tax=Thorsellia kenyensis TaxID=1549888 RepID=A0ABV6C790_9GAMM